MVESRADRTTRNPRCWVPCRRDVLRKADRKVVQEVADHDQPARDARSRWRLRCEVRGAGKSLAAHPWRYRWRLVRYPELRRLRRLCRLAWPQGQEIEAPRVWRRAGRRRTEPNKEPEGRHRGRNRGRRWGKRSEHGNWGDHTKLLAAAGPVRAVAVQRTGGRLHGPVRGPRVRPRDGPGPPRRCDGKSCDGIYVDRGVRDGGRDQSIPATLQGRATDRRGEPCCGRPCCGSQGGTQ